MSELPAMVKGGDALLRVMMVTSWLSSQQRLKLGLLALKPTSLLLNLNVRRVAAGNHPKWICHRGRKIHLANALDKIMLVHLS